MITKKQAVELLWNYPYKFGQLVGFTRLTELHNTWIKDMLATGSSDSTLQAHRGSYKTTCISIALAILAVLKADKKILFMRKTDNDIKEIILQTSRILRSEYMEYLAWCIYGIELKLTKDTSNEITTNLSHGVKGTAQITGRGISGSITGKHYDLIFTDDIINIDDRFSNAERERTKRVYQELQNLRNVGGRIYNTGTPWHKDDCFQLMPAPKKYDCYSTGLLNADEIAKLKESMTASLFAANYELRHIPADDVIFKNPQFGYDSALAENGITHVDSAYYGEDYTAMSIVTRRDGKFYVFGKCWRKHIEQCMADIVEYHNRFKSKVLYNERNADKGYVVKEFRKLGVKAVGYDETQNKVLKITSVLKFVWSNVFFVEGTDSEYIQQICDYNELAEHDDCPDSLACAIREWNKRGTDVYKSMWDNSL